MIKAKHKWWADIIFEKYIYRLMKKSFHSVQIIGDKPKVPNKPIILLCNHSSWWDGFFIYLINKKIFNKKFHILMLEDQLKRYLFFNYLGAYSINQENPKKIIESINYSAELTKNNNNLINIYPEGKMDYSFKNNVNYKLGIDRILEKSGDVEIIQCAMKIISLHDQKPHVFFNFSHSFNKSIKSKILQENMNQLLEEIDNNLNNGTLFFKGKTSK